MTTEEARSPGWDGLAGAVVQQAMADYLFFLRKAARAPGLRSVEKELRNLERFFRSPWFSTLSCLDGRKILEQLRKEVA